MAHSDRPDPDRTTPPANDEEALQAEGERTLDRRRPLRRSFPGPPGARELLRLAFDRAAYAEVVSHTQGSLEAEVCGVLVGDVCEDEEGVFVHVRASIRGGATDHGSTHVTFTHETWNEIHSVLQRDYPRLQIVGWYHSHPGFGVEFSEMDKFIQENFFPAPCQFALLTDPLGGKVALCCNSERGVRPLGRFWVEGREHRCEPPSGEGLAAPEGAAGASAEDVEALRNKLTQVTLTLEELRASLHRFLVAGLMVVCLGTALVVTYAIYRSVTAPNKPPELVSYAPIPLQVGDQLIMLGVGVVGWEVPPAQTAAYLRQLARQLQKLPAPSGVSGLPRSGASPGSAPSPPTPRR